MGERDSCLWLLTVCRDDCTYRRICALHPSQAAGHFWGRLGEARPCHCRLLGACGRESLLMNSCMLSASYTSNPDQTVTTMSQLYGKTSCQVRTFYHYVILIAVARFFTKWVWRCFFFFFFLAEHIHNFRKQVTNNLNSPYDYTSVMHYGRWVALWFNIIICHLDSGITVSYMFCIFDTDMPSLKMADQQ